MINFQSIFQGKIRGKNYEKRGISSGVKGIVTMKKNRKQKIVSLLSAAVITSSALAMSASASTYYTDYFVEKGDNLYRLALEYSTTVEEIVVRNGIQDKNVLSVHQYLSIPTNTRVYGGVDYYQAVQGDTLRIIAARFGTTVTQLAAWNNISNVNHIIEGQTLRVGYANTYYQLQEPVVEYYQVEAGDTLRHIAVRYGKTVSQLASWNNIHNVNVIEVGDILRVSTIG